MTVAGSPAVRADARRVSLKRAARQGRALLIAILVMSSSAAAAAAADATGRYAVDGAGRATCGHFANVGAEDRETAAIYSGWIEGYVSAFNHFNPETYDITPWQSAELLYAKLRNFCEARPETRFVDAVNQLLQTLYDQRLTQQSDIIRIRVGEQAVFLSEALLPRIRAALIEAGSMDAEAAPGAGTKAIIAGLRQFQSDNKLPISGLPDQPTLNALFP